MATEIDKIVRQIKRIGPDMTKPLYPQDHQPPLPGIARARLVAYLEMGLHEEEFEGKKRDREKVDLIFELSGPNYPARITDEWLIPIRITVQETLSLEPRSNFFKLFANMNYLGNATHMIELLGMPYLVEVFHVRSRDDTQVFATLKGSLKSFPGGYGYKITSPEYPDPLTELMATVKVDPAITDLKAFVWKLASKAMWDSIYIPGEYAERKDDKTGEVISKSRSKNVIQEKIKSAKNWPPLGLVGVI